MELNADNIGQYVLGLELKIQTLERMKAINVDQFYAVKMTVPEVAKLHNVDAQTVRHHVKRGAIETHPDSTDSYTYIRGSVALALDFKQLRKESRRH